MKEGRVVMKNVTKYCLILFLFLGFSSAYAADPEEPYNKDYLLNPQDHLHVINIDASNPPSNLPLATEIFLARSQGGVIVHWSRTRDYPSDVNLHVPIPEGVDDVKVFLQELAQVYGITNVEQQFNVSTSGVQIPNDTHNVFPQTSLYILQHVCKNLSTEVRVMGSQFVFTADFESRTLTRMSSTYKPVECVEPGSLLTTEQLALMFTNIQSPPKLLLAPAGTYASVSGSVYVYRFRAHDRYYEVRADNGQVLYNHSVVFGAYGLEREMLDTSTNPVSDICRDTDVLGDYNSSGGVACVDPYKDFYDSAYWGIRVFLGTTILSASIGFGRTIRWGESNKKEIRLVYDEIGGNGTGSDFGNYHGDRVSFSQYPSNFERTTRTQDSSGNPLPGLGGVVDLVSHEVGHGFIDVNIEQIVSGASSGAYISPRTNNHPYKIGRAITEALADIIGKTAEMSARHSYAGCHANFEPSCGGSSQADCGANPPCERGEFCNNGICAPCHDACVTQKAAATVDWKFAHTYHNTAEHVFVGGDSFRDLSWQPSPITCPTPTTTIDIVQRYTNGLFLSRLLALYNSTTDKFHGIPGYMRNVGDIAVQEKMLYAMMYNLPEDPSVRIAAQAWLAALADVIKFLPDAYYNIEKMKRVTTQAGVLRTKHASPIQGKCTYLCDPNDNKYVCVKP